MIVESSEQRVLLFCYSNCTLLNNRFLAYQATKCC